MHFRARLRSVHRTNGYFLARSLAYSDDAPLFPQLVHPAFSLRSLQEMSDPERQRDRERGEGVAIISEANQLALPPSIAIKPRTRDLRQERESERAGRAAAACIEQRRCRSKTPKFRDHYSVEPPNKERAFSTTGKERREKRKERRQSAKFVARVPLSPRDDVSLSREACSAERRKATTTSKARSRRPGRQADRRALPPDLPLSPSLPPSLVRIATVLDRTIHPYKSRIWFWIGAVRATAPEEEEETQKQLHR